MKRVRSMLVGTGMSAKSTDEALKKYKNVIDAATLNPMAKITKAKLLQKDNAEIVSVQVDPKKYFEGLKSVNQWIVKGNGDSNELVSVYHVVSATKDTTVPSVYEFTLTKVWGKTLSVEKLKGSIVFFVGNQFGSTIQQELESNVHRFPKSWISKMSMSSFMKLSSFLDQSTSVCPTQLPTELAPAQEDVTVYDEKDSDQEKSTNDSNESEGETLESNDCEC